MKLKNLLLTLVVLFTVNTHATEYYMSPNGDDTNPGTLAQPWKTLDRLQTAQDILKPGDVVLFREGNYLINDSAKNGTYRFSAKGTELSRITYKKYANEVPVILYDRRIIDGGKTNQVAFFPGQYTTFDGITFRQTEASRCVALNPDCLTRSEDADETARYYANSVRAMTIQSSHVTIRNCVIDNFSSVGLATPGANTIVEYTTIKNISNHGMYLQGPNGIFRYNTIDGIRQIPSGGGGRYGIQIQYEQTTNNKVYGNIIKNTVSAAVIFSGKISYNEVYNNVFINSGRVRGEVVSTWTEDGPVGVGNRFYNNTTIGKTSYSVFGGKIPEFAKIDIRNNIFYPSTPIGIGVPESYTNITGNIFYNVIDAIPKGNRLINPKLVDPTGTTAQAAMLMSGSPAIDAGFGSDFPAEDYSEHARPTKFDVGAFEFGTSSRPLTPRRFQIKSK